MFKSAASKVMWVGRTAATIFGVALVLALIFGVATMALAALPGDPLKLGQVNRINNALTTLIGSRSGAMMLIDNDSNAANATALHLRVQPDRPPFAIYSDKRVNYLNADKLDGMHASELAAPRGYAHIADEGAVDPAYPSKGVNGVVIPEGETFVYCFDLAFTPDGAFASPFLTNNAVVSTVTPPNGLLTNECPATHRDAAAKTYSEPFNFQIMFL